MLLLVSLVAFSVQRDVQNRLSSLSERLSERPPERFDVATVADAIANCKTAKTSFLGSKDASFTYCAECNANFVPINGECLSNTDTLSKMCLKDSKGSKGSKGSKDAKQPIVCTSCGAGFFLFEGGCYHVSSANGNKLCHRVVGDNCVLAKPGVYINETGKLTPCNTLNPTNPPDKPNEPKAGDCLECGLVNEKPACFRCAGDKFGPINGTCTDSTTLSPPPDLPEPSSGVFTSCVSTTQNPTQNPPPAYFLYNGGCYVTDDKKTTGSTTPFGSPDLGNAICTAEASSVIDGVCVLPKPSFYTRGDGGVAVTRACDDVLSGGVVDCFACFWAARVVCTACKTGSFLAVGVSGAACEPTAQRGCTASVALDAATIICTACEKEKVPIDGVCVVQKKTKEKKEKEKGKKDEKKEDTVCTISSSSPSGTCKACAAPYFLFSGGCYNAGRAPGNRLCAVADTTTGCSVAAPGFFIESGKPNEIQSCSEEIPGCTSCVPRGTGTKSKSASTSASTSASKPTIWCTSCASGTVPIDGVCVSTALGVVRDACPEAAAAPAAGCGRCAGAFLTFKNGCYDIDYPKIDSTKVCSNNVTFKGTPSLTFCTECGAGLISVDGICVEKTSETARRAGAFPTGTTKSPSGNTKADQTNFTSCSSGFLLFEGGCYNASAAGAYICPPSNQYTIPCWAATLCSGCNTLANNTKLYLSTNGMCSLSTTNPPPPTPPPPPCNGQKEFLFQESCFNTAEAPGSFICAKADSQSGNCTALAKSATFVHLIEGKVELCSKSIIGCIECATNEGGNVSHCLKCSSEYALGSNGQCLACNDNGGDVNCLRCSSPNGVRVHCDVCKPGYVHNHATERCDPAPCTADEECGYAMYCSKGVCRPGREITSPGPTPCVLSDASGRCLRCLTDYVLSACGECRSCRRLSQTNPGADPSCAACVLANVGVTCTACDKGYMLVDGRCLDCSTYLGEHHGCSLCVQGRSTAKKSSTGEVDDFSVCTGCAFDAMSISPDGSQCVSACGDNATEINGVCLCDYGYVIGNTKDCVPPDSNINTYNTPGLNNASYCPTGFYARYVLPSNSAFRVQCARCRISGCTRCTWHAGREVCTRCPAGRALYEPSCDVRCPANCRRCRLSSGQQTCLECNPGYAINKTTCVQMGSDPHCRNYTLIAGTPYCNTCHSGYYPFGGVCVGKPTENTRGLAAVPDTGLTADGVCNVTGDGKCSECMDDFLLLEGGCYSTDYAPGLFLCKGAGPKGKCVNTTSAGAFYGYPGLRLENNNNNNNIVDETTGCIEYNGSGCVICDVGYYKGDDGCAPCNTIQDCAECIGNDSKALTCVLYRTENTSIRTEVGIALWIVTTSALIIGIYIWRYRTPAAESGAFHEVLVNSVVLEERRSFDGLSSFCASTTSLV